MNRKVGRTEFWEASPQGGEVLEHSNQDGNGGWFERGLEGRINASLIFGDGLGVEGTRE